MKRKTIFAVALASALALGALAGCSGQSPAPSNTSSSASSTAAQTQDEILSELKGLVADVPEYKSVTIVEETTSELIQKDEAATESKDAEAKAQTKDENTKSVESKEVEKKSGESVSEAASTIASTAVNVATEAAEKAMNEVSGQNDTIKSKTVYKFDASGDKMKTSMEGEIDGIKLAYYSYGDDAVLVTDGPVYSGTIEQFDETWFKGPRAYLEERMGDLSVLVDCASAVEKTENDGIVTYTLTLDPKKYTETNEAYKIMTANGDELVDVKLVLSFDKDGYIVKTCQTSEFSGGIKSTVELTLSDYDKTTVQDMPEATATYDQMNSDIQKKMSDFFKDVNTGETAEAPAATTAQ